jgi:hypothetical protein
VEIDDRGSSMKRAVVVFGVGSFIV